jgi:PIN domain nuclease of toxin-antitoxin system
MRVLIDTHALLWYLQGDASLTNLSLTTIEDKDNNVFVSIVSLWEIAIKLGLGKLELQRPFENLEADLQRLDLKILPIAFAVLPEIAEDILPLQSRHQCLRLVRVASALPNRVRQFRWRFVDEFLRSRFDVRYRDEQEVAGRSPRLLQRWSNVRYPGDFE